MRVRVLVLAALAGGGCVKSQAVVCSDGTICAPGTVCDEAHGQCLLPDQLTSCADKQPGDACPIAGLQGVCREGLCLAVICGDGITEGSEQCDGAPPALTCYDSGYDAGFLGCLDVCAPAFSGCRRVGWRDVSIPGTGAVHSLSAAGGVMLGYRGSIIVRFDGTAWQPMVLPGNSGFVLAVVATSADHGFAATEDGLYHLDGDVWQLDPESLDNSTRARFAAVSENDVYMFLDAGVRHFDGQTWSPAAGVPAPILDVWASSAGEVWVLDVTRTVQRKQGTGWTPVPTPLARVDSVRGFGTTVFVTGWTAADRAAVARWNGASWDVFDVTVELGAPAGLPRISLGGRSATDFYVFASGESHMVYFDGERWQRSATLATPVYEVASLEDATFAATATGVALEAPNSLVDIADVVSATAPTTGGIAVAGTSCADVYVISSSVSLAAGGAVFRFDGASWAHEHTIASGSITDVFATDDGDVYATAVTETGGELLRRTTGTWSTFKTFATGPRAVWAAPGGIVVVVADQGWVHRFDGAWTSVQLPSTAFEDVWGTSATDIVAVRSQPSPLVHFDGTEWTDVAVPATMGRMRAIWGDDAGTLIVVGELGEALHREQGEWRRERLPFDNYTAAHGATAGDVFAVAQQGTMAHFDGTHWAPIRNTTRQPTSVWTAGACTYVTGDYSTIELHLLSRREPW